tara:strand:+ start:244 stop:450 length:207 start_codon:yes stop_codon:yes gene_type:complete
MIGITRFPKLYRCDSSSRRDMAYDTLLVSPKTSRAGSPTMYDLATYQKAGKFRHWVREVLLISAVYKN